MSGSVNFASPILFRTCPSPVCDSFSHVLITRYSGSKEDRQDKALAFLAAVRRGDIKIVRHFLKEGISIIKEILPNESSVLNCAVKEGLTCLLEV